MVFNKGINDLSSKEKSYDVWHSMIRRCYSSVYHITKPTYIGIQVSDDWLLHSNFNKWFVLNYVDNWQLDKDLLFKDERMYSEKNCVFLPNEINCALNTDKGLNGLPSGVSYKSSHYKYVAQLSTLTENGVRKNTHLLISESAEDCFNAYKIAKEKYMFELSQKYKQQLDKRAYNALINFKVER